MKVRDEYVPVVVFTGAGASCAKGIDLPNMTQFFDRIMDKKSHTATHELIKQGEYFKYIMDRLYGDIPAAVYDLEKVLGTLYKVSGAFSDDDAFSIFNEETLIQRITLAVHQDGKARIINSDGAQIHVEQTKSIIRSTIEHRYAEIKRDARTLLHELQMVIRLFYSDVNVQGIYDVYGEFFRKLLLSAVKPVDLASANTQVTMPIFTTNYDPSIDYVLQPHTTTECRVKHRDWRGSITTPFRFVDGFVADEYESAYIWSEDAFSAEIKHGVLIPYHKLHGSVRWEKMGDEILKTTNVVSDITESPRNFIMIYPSDKTTPESNPYAFSHREFERYMNKTKVLIIIGFAFRDPGLVNIIKRSLRVNEKLRVIVVGPTPNNWESEYEEFLHCSNRIEHVDGYFGEVDVTEKLMSKVIQRVNESNFVATA